LESLHLPKHQKDSLHSQSLIENHSEVSQEWMSEVMNDEESQNPNTQSQCEHLFSMQLNGNKYLSLKLNLDRWSIKLIRHS
jgi:hypothetical protein